MLFRSCCFVILYLFLVENVNLTINELIDAFQRTFQLRYQRLYAVTHFYNFKTHSREENKMLPVVAKVSHCSPMTFDSLSTLHQHSRVHEKERHD